MGIRIERIDEWRARVGGADGGAPAALLFAPESMRIEAKALSQLAAARQLDPRGVVLATPDIHTGYGVPIGCVFASERYVVPAAVGYDINCGMRLLTTPLEADGLDAERLAGALARQIPLGEGRSNVDAGARGVEAVLRGGVPALRDIPGVREAPGFDADELAADTARVESGGALEGDPAAVPARAKDRGRTQLGTLGGGNHFIEIQRVEAAPDEGLAAAWGLRPGAACVMIHSGSRGFGHEVGGTFMKEAVRVAERTGAPARGRELACMPADAPEARAYLGAMRSAANYAYANRQVMAQLVRHVLRRELRRDLALPTLYDIAHNVATPETHEVAGSARRLLVHRKGATRAFPPSRMGGTPFAETGQPVLIPGSMGTASYVLVGTASAAGSLFSVNHGAGRVMSRTAAAGPRRGGKAARRRAGISDEAFRRSMAGVHLVTADRRRIKEEAPAAYKDIDLVIGTVVGAGLARVVARLRPLAVLKG